MLGLRRKRLHHSKKRGRKRKLLFLILLFFGIYFFLSYRVISKNGKEVIAQARVVKEALVHKNNIDEAQKELNVLQTKYNAFQKSARWIYWVRFIPLVGGYVSDFRHGVEAGDNMLAAGKISLEAIAPYADLIGLKQGQSTFAEKSADDRIQTAVLTLDKVLVKVDDIAVYVEKARDHVEQINENRYPTRVAGHNIRPRINSLKNQFDGAASFFVDAKPLMKKLPEILGSQEEKTYIVLFENDKELRPTGGFLTAYAIFKVNKGKIQAVRSSDIYQLDDSISRHPKAPEKVLLYHKDVSTFNIRDSNLSPDFPTSVELFDSLYQKSSQKTVYDGIFTVDTQVLVDTLGILGDTEVRGTVFSAQEDKRCDCPQVIYKLLDEIDRPVGYIKENRKGILGDLLYVLMQKALGFSPSQYWGPLSQEMIRNLQQKHILIYLKDEEAQKAVEAINFGGRIREYQGDYLHISDTNFAGAKSNLFVNHIITSDTVFKQGGVVERKLIIDYKNPYSHSDCNLERGGLCINATLRNWLRIYVPQGARLVAFQGSEKKVQTYDELGKTVFEGYLRVQPKGKATVTITYELPFKIDNKKDYKLLIQKQPGTKGHQFNVLIDGRKRDTFQLIEDKEFKLE